MLYIFISRKKARKPVSMMNSFAFSKSMGLVCLKCSGSNWVRRDYMVEGFYLEVALVLDRKSMYTSTMSFLSTA